MTVGLWRTLPFFFNRISHVSFVDANDKAMASKLDILLVLADERSLLPIHVSELLAQRR
ncbi:MAG: hypothetical protein ABI969_05575 [bacterium]